MCWTNTWNGTTIHDHSNVHNVRKRFCCWKISSDTNRNTIKFGPFVKFATNRFRWTVHFVSTCCCTRASANISVTIATHRFRPVSADRSMNMLCIAWTIRLSRKHSSHLCRLFCSRRPCLRPVIIIKILAHTYKYGGRTRAGKFINNMIKENFGRLVRHIHCSQQVNILLCFCRCS